MKTLPQRPDLAPLLNSVESMGCACELGLIQRHCKAEPMGLLRFGVTPLHGLVEALRADFAGIGDPLEYDYNVSPQGEWMAYHRRYKFESHTSQRADQMAEARVRDIGTKRLKILGDLFMQNLRDAKKLFVYRPQKPGLALERRLELLRAMRRFGNAQLMWLDIPEDARRIGSAEWTEPGGLITGYVDCYPFPTPHANFNVWVQVIQAADSLRKAAGIS